MLYNKGSFLGNRNARDIIKKLKKAGFQFVSQRGSHIKMKRDSTIIIIPKHGGKDLGTGLIKKIESQSNVKLLD